MEYSHTSDASYDDGLSIDIKDVQSYDNMEKSIEIPQSLRSIITQSDSSGNPLPVHFNSSKAPNSPTSKSAIKLNISSLEISDQKISDNRKKKSWIIRNLCCFPKQGNDANISSTSSNTIQNSSSTFSKQKVYHPGSPKKFPSSSKSHHKPWPPVVPKLPVQLNRKKCLALDLDETLVHSSFQPIKNANYVIPVVMDGTIHKVYVVKRPGVDEFLHKVKDYYEIILYTASLSKYADPLLDELDKNKCIDTRLFRENCVFHNGHYVKDLSLFQNRDISQIVIVDNSPMSYMFHPENAIGCSSFIDNQSDIELWQIGDFLLSIRDSDDVRRHCKLWKEWCKQYSSSATPENSRRTL